MEFPRKPIKEKKKLNWDILNAKEIYYISCWVKNKLKVVKYISGELNVDMKSER